MVDDYGRLLGMTAMNISKFKATCLSVVEQIRVTGEPVMLLKNGEPIALVSPPPRRPNKSGFGSMSGRGEILADLTEPLGVGDWEALR